MNIILIKAPRLPLVMHWSQQAIFAKSFLLNGSEEKGMIKVFLPQQPFRQDLSLRAVWLPSRTFAVRLIDWMNQVSLSRDPSLPLKQIISVSRCDRWQVCYRLRELNITCNCLKDGQVEVEIDTPLAAVQVWSVFQQATASRQHQVQWLARCWCAY